tara:strand:- start:58672 stop:60726 length:2055 start_codon:yes stop_codon:yes gene_type:complete
MKCPKLPKKEIFLYIIILISCNFIYSQGFKDSLISKLSIAKHDTIRVELLIEAGDKFFPTHPDTAYVYYNRALGLSKKVESAKSKANSLLRIGKYFNYKKEPKTSIVLYLEALEIFIAIDNQTGVGDCYRYIGDSFANLNSLNTSTEYYLKSLHVYESINDKEGVGLIFNILGDMHWYHKNYDLAYDYYSKAEVIFIEQGDKYNILNCYINLGNVLADRGNIEEGKEYYFKSIKIAQEIEDYQGIALNYCNLGDVYLQEGDYKNALKYFDKSIELTQKFDYKSLDQILYLNYSETYLKLKNYKKAIFYANKSINTSLYFSWEDKYFENYSLISKAYAKLGNYEKAYENQKIYLKYSDSIYNVKKFEKLASSKVLYELENQEGEIKSLIKNEELRTLQLSNQKTLSYILMASLVFFLILVFLLYTQRNSKKKAYSLLSKEKEKLFIQMGKAEESDHLKSAFLANMSHEIRTPMNAIIGFSSFLKNPELEVEKRDRFIDVIVNSGERLMTIINDIIDISKIESNQLKVDLDTVNVNSILKEIDEIQKRTNGFIIANKIEIKLNVPKTAKDIFIKTDENRFIQILNNLINNASKFTKSGSIEVGYNLVENPESSFLEFYVKDTGCGIPKDKLKMIFDRFSQAGDKDFKTGNGLGLSICKGLLTEMNGEIWVESEVGVGTTFYFKLPY